MRATLLPTALLLTIALVSAPAGAYVFIPDEVWAVSCKEAGDPHDPHRPSNTCRGVYTIMDDGKVCHFEQDGGYRHDVCYKVLP